MDESSTPLTHRQRDTTAPTTFGRVEVGNDKDKGRAKYKKLPLYQDRPAMCELLGIHLGAKLAMNDYLRCVQRACLERGLHLEDRWTSYDEDKVVRPMLNTVRSLMKDHFGIEFPRNLVRALMHRCCINNKRASTKRLQRRGLKGKRGRTGKGEGEASHCNDPSDAGSTNGYTDDSSDGGGGSSDSNDSEATVPAMKRRCASAFTGKGRTNSESIYHAAGGATVECPVTPYPLLASASGSKSKQPNLISGTSCADKPANVRLPQPPARLSLDPGICSTTTKEQHAKQAVEQEPSVIRLHIERPGNPIPKQLNVNCHASWSKIEHHIRVHTFAEDDSILQYRAHGCDNKDPWFPIATIEDWANLTNKFGVGGVDIRKAPETEWLSPGHTDDEV